MSHSEGFTILEAMVSLAITALILSVSVVAISRGSPRLEQQGAMVELLAEARAARRQAIKSGAPVHYASTAVACGSEIPAEITFFSDGSALGDDICIVNDNRTTRIELDELTGRLELRQ